MKAPRRDVALVVVAALAFATAAPFGKIASTIPAIVLACARTAPAALVLALASRTQLFSSFRALAPKDRVRALLTGVILAGHFALFLAGLARTSLAAAVALVALEPISVVIWAFVVFGIRPSARELVGLGVATVGALVVASASGSGEHRISGDLLVLGCVVLYGAYVAAARSIREAMPVIPFAATVFGVTAIVLLPAAIPLALAAPPSPPRAWIAVLGLAIFPTLIGHTLVQVGARRAPPVVVALVSPGEAVGSILIGTTVAFAGLGDVLHMTAPTPLEAAGALLILGGATVVVTAKRPP